MNNQQLIESLQYYLEEYIDFYRAQYLKDAKSGEVISGNEFHIQKEEKKIVDFLNKNLKNYINLFSQKELKDLYDFSSYEDEYDREEAEWDARDAICDSRAGRSVIKSLKNNKELLKYCGSYYSAIGYRYQQIYEGKSKYFNLTSLGFGAHMEDYFSSLTSYYGQLAEIVQSVIEGIYDDNPWPNAVIEGVYDFCNRNKLNIVTDVDNQGKLLFDQINSKFLLDKGFNIKQIMRRVK